MPIRVRRRKVKRAGIAMHLAEKALSVVSPDAARANPVPLAKSGAFAANMERFDRWRNQM